MSRRRIQSKRQTRKQFIKPLVVILGDGKTEQDYVERLKEFDCFKNVNLKYEKGSEENFEIKLKEHLHNKNNVLVILDIDNESKSTLRYDKIKHLIKKYKNQIFYNNYSFETWLLNHKTCFSKPVIDKKEYDEDIKKVFGVDSWSKYKNKRNRNKIMKQIKTDDIDTACKNTKIINKNKWDNNPSSNMDLMVNKIRKTRE